MGCPPQFITRLLPSSSLTWGIFVPFPDLETTIMCTRQERDLSKLVQRQGKGRGVVVAETRQKSPDFTASAEEDTVSQVKEGKRCTHLSSKIRAIRWTVQDMSLDLGCRIQRPEKYLCLRHLMKPGGPRGCTGDSSQDCVQCTHQPCYHFVSLQMLWAIKSSDS